MGRRAKGSTRVTWRCPHQPKTTAKTCKLNVCPGSWYGRVRFGAYEVERGRFNTQSEAQDWASTELSKVILGLPEGEEPQRGYTRHSKVTVNVLMDHFEDYLLERVQLGTLSAGTAQGYRDHIRVYIRPLIGKMELSALWIGEVRNFHARCKELRPWISGENQKRINATLSGAITFAQREKEREGWFTRLNPCQGQTFAPSRHKPRSWDVEEVRRFWQFAREDEYFPVYAVLTLQGPRRGEAIGMYEEAIDWDTLVWEVSEQITIESLKGLETSLEAGGKVPGVTKEIKTARKGVKTKFLALNPDLVPLLQQLAARARRLRVQAAKEGRFFYQDPDGKTLLMIHENGRPFSPRNVSDRFKAIISVAGLPKIDLRELRTTHANLLQATGASPRLIQEVLGHSDGSAVTNQHYLLASIKEQHQRQAAISQALALSPLEDGPEDDPTNVVPFLR